MKQHLLAVSAALALVISAGPPTPCAAAPSATPPYEASGAPTDVIHALAGAVEASVARTRPPHWPRKRACLYYALAGQALLAQQGIPAMLRVGRVVYRPGTASAHPIAPHAWLETADHFIDYAMLPRRGAVAVIATERLATHPAHVLPGVTRVLALAAEPDESLGLYLGHHYRRFHGRWIAARRQADRSAPAGDARTPGRAPRPGR
jgi:hypothetical protein